MRKSLLIKLKAYVMFFFHFYQTAVFSQLRAAELKHEPDWNLLSLEHSLFTLNCQTLQFFEDTSRENCIVSSLKNSALIDNSNLQNSVILYD